MRLATAPVAFIGGPFKTGKISEALDDGPFSGRMEIEFQTMTPDSSRVVWLGVIDQRLT